MRENLLFLVHRIPYPPNKGDKIRSFHFLKALSQRYQIFLGSFIDDPNDWQYADTVKNYCQESCIESLDPLQSKIKSLTGLLTCKALSLPYYKNPKLQQWVNDVIERHQIRKVLIFSSVMGQYVLNREDLTLIADYVDVDSDKWRQYAEKKTWPESWIYRRESERLLEFEKQLISQAKAGFFVSEQEAGLFKTLAPEFEDRIGSVNNGVDTNYFSPDHAFDSPYRPESQVLAFTGAMDYWANVDAVKWFAEKVFPAIRKKHPNTEFYIVGSKPTKDVLSLAQIDGVVVTGSVDDVRPFIAHADLVVTPLRIARGIQNKVLEAMAMAKPVIATSMAIEGIPVNDSLNVAIIDDVQPFADRVCEALAQGKGGKRSENNRRFVLENFSWQTSTDRLLELIG
ncbi:TIGR03087 family PEP-CTERM/XrtA system glycosyltransferase [Methylotuvimicrobium alcaliphilum]|uniref:Glycosyl transferase, group 1 n=1 Tax=Methylotuvimicrobium alcaliphilum (strain DSM 19304 / NCIMB 14124 / VKM B-2133 / 20Z) TaxID=1091494 RepID=G4SXS4_META2|nr:TIGR03087 family PEP-CTERM/XrtA system glycosyltransferase [Methylotuvimicrobium alcaliphilum]CCE23118.1 Glycosyl transferase, group 1 [Methylotuvimicrobium alcaliphilum 20Z]